MKTISNLFLLLGRKEGEDMDLITYATDIKGHDMRYAIDSRKLQKELGWEPSLQFAEGIEKTVSKQSLRAVLRTLIKIYTFAPNFKFGTK